MPRPKKYKTEFTLEQCKSQINVFNGKAFLNLQLPDGRLIVFESAKNRVIPEYMPQQVTTNQAEAKTE